MAEPCARCGSDRVIPGVPLLDHYGDMGTRSSPAAVRVDAKPEAWLFKGSATGNLVAVICGACGHVDLSVNNPAELYAAYRRSLGPPDVA